MQKTSTERFIAEHCVPKASITDHPKSENLSAEDVRAKMESWSKNAIPCCVSNTPCGDLKTILYYSVFFSGQTTRPNDFETQTHKVYLVTQLKVVRTTEESILVTGTALPLALLPQLRGKWGLSINSSKLKQINCK